MPGNCIRGCKLQALVSLRVFWTVRKAIFYPWKVFLRVLCTNNNLRLLSYVEDNIQFNFVSTVWIKNYLCWRLQVRFPGLTSNPCFVLFRFFVALSNFKYQSTSKALVESVGWSVLIITLRFISLLWVLAPAPCPFFLLAWFWLTQERLYIMNQLRSWFSMHGVFLGYSFKPRLNSHPVAGTAGSTMHDHQLINKRMLAPKLTCLKREIKID